MKTMKTIYTVMVLMMANLVMAQNFEGVINMKTTNEEMKEKATLTWYLKGDKSRMDISSQAGEISTDYTIISDEKGLDMVAEGHVTAINKTALDLGLPTVTLLSEKNAVQMNGYTCKQAVYFDGKSQTTYWLTDALGLTFNDIPAIIRRNMPTIDSNGFPVRMEKRNAEGKVILTQEVVSTQAAKVEDSKFDR
ncbi:MAG: DUF4412 domain-containing protein [Flavobacteriales bacterium]|nr:DUF4412 domain-containing protein [Flavobacteriales bacterium]